MVLFGLIVILVIVHSEIVGVVTLLVTYVYMKYKKPNQLTDMANDMNNMMINDTASVYSDFSSVYDETTHHTKPSVNNKNRKSISNDVKVSSNNQTRIAPPIPTSRTQIKTTTNTNHNSGTNVMYDSSMYHDDYYDLGSLSSLDNYTSNLAISPAFSNIPRRSGPQMVPEESPATLRMRNMNTQKNLPRYMQPKSAR